MKTLYTAHATAVGGRGGHVETDDKNLVLELASPGGKTDKTGQVTNPEQLFACGYAACFGSAIEAVAKKQGVEVKDVSVTATVHLLQEESGGYRIGAALEVKVPGLDTNTTQKLVEAAHQICPYSKATRGNIEVEVKAG